MTERTIVNAIIDAVYTKYGQRVWVRKLADRHTRGLPDLLIIWTPGVPVPAEMDVKPHDVLWALSLLTKEGHPAPGRTLLVEVKRPGKKQTPLQKHEAGTVNRLGVPWICASCPQDVLEWME